MALKVKAKEQYQNIGKYAGTFRYVMMPELYTALAQDKVIKEAALRSGVSRGVMQACWDAAGRITGRFCDPLWNPQGNQRGPL